jgi:hypothetical protein
LLFGSPSSRFAFAYRFTATGLSRIRRKHAKADWHAMRFGLFDGNGRLADDDWFFSLGG